MRFHRSVARVVAVSACLATVVAGLTVASAPAARADNPYGIVADGPIESFLNASPPKCVDDLWANTNDHNIIDLYDCNGTAAQDMYIVVDGTIRVLGKCLDVNAGGTANGTVVQLYTCNGTGAQQWVQVGSELQNPQSGRCLDDPGGNTSNGTQLVIWDCHSAQNQLWQVPGQPSVSYPGGDLVGSMDDGGVPDALMQQIISSYWPESVGAPDEPSQGPGPSTWVNTVLSDEYNALGARVGGNPPAPGPPDLTGATVTVSGGVVSVDVPASTVAANDTPGWIVSAWAAVFGTLAGILALGACAIFAAAPLTVAATHICFAVSSFVGTSVWFIAYYLMTGTPIDENTLANTFAAALVAAGIGAFTSFATAWLLRNAPGTMAWVGGKVRDLFYNAVAWFGGRARPLGDQANVELGNLSAEVPALALQYAQANGMATPIASGPVTSGFAGKCLNDNGALMNNYDTIILHSCSGTPNESWTVWSNNMVEMNARCLDVIGGGTTASTKVQLYDCNGTGAQQWIQEGSSLVNPQSGMCLDDPGANPSDGTVQQIYPCNETIAQQWILP